jgi:DNA-directed RNA polymerase subunit E'/Rpb7
MISDERENVWYWLYDESYNLFYDIGEEVRLKVLDVNFKTKNELNKISGKQNANVEILDTEDKQIEVFSLDMIMEINCSFNQEGLGPLKWWS